MKGWAVTTVNGGRPVGASMSAIVDREDETFVVRRIEAHAIGKVNQHREDEHVLHGDHIEGLRIKRGSWRHEIPAKRIRSGQNTENHHE